MKLLYFGLWLGCVVSPTARSQQASPRVALIGFTHRSPRDSAALFAKVENRLTTSLSSDPRVLLVDESIVRPALSGLGYGGSINMSRDEARRVGSAIGCDFFITGKLEVFTRSERKSESHEEAFAGVMIVDGRTGELAVFDFISEKGATRDVALSAVAKALGERVTGYIDRLIQIRAGGRVPASTAPATSGATAADLIEDIPDEDSPRAAGFTPPQFLSRVKPGYTSEAGLADITATVEVMVVFRSNGEVGGIEITRWAGFGLDESAAAAIRQLKYTPAMRDGNPINVRAMIRYNFRRVSEPSQQPELPAPKPPDKPERDLRELWKPTYRRP
ncbi:MAG: energy transducer TonB [Acidobacteriota bacterium]